MDIDAVCTKATSRLHFLEILQRSSLNSSDLFLFLHSCHSSNSRIRVPCVAQQSTKPPDRICSETRIVNNIRSYTGPLRPVLLCSDKQLPTLHYHRTELSKSFYLTSLSSTRVCTVLVMSNRPNECQVNWF